MNQDEWPIWANEPVIIEAYDPRWPNIASELIEELQSSYNFGDGHFEHIGSTAIPGLSSKPIVDLMVAVENFNDITMIQNILKDNSWNLIPPDLDNRTYRRTFVKVINNKRFAHFHLVTTNSEELKMHVGFRNILRENPLIKEDYSRLKTELAAKYQNDREKYTDAKSKFIKEVLDEYLL